MMRLFQILLLLVPIFLSCSKAPSIGEKEIANQAAPTDRKKEEERKGMRKLLCRLYELELRHQGYDAVVLETGATDMVVISPQASKYLAERMLSPSTLKSLAGMGFSRVTFETAPGTWVGEVRVREQLWVFR